MRSVRCKTWLWTPTKAWPRQTRLRRGGRPKSYLQLSQFFSPQLPPAQPAKMSAPADSMVRVRLRKRTIFLSAACRWESCTSLAPV